LFEGISRYTKDQKVTGAAKDKSYLTNLVAFYDGKTGLTDKGGPGAFIYLTLVGFGQSPMVSFCVMWRNMHCMDSLQHRWKSGRTTRLRKRRWQQFRVPPAVG